MLSVLIMKMDLTKYIMKIIVVPVLFLSLILIAHGSDDSISAINIIGMILLFISGIVIINFNKDE